MLQGLLVPEVAQPIMNKPNEVLMKILTILSQEKPADSQRRDIGLRGGALGIWRWCHFLRLPHQCQQLVKLPDLQRVLVHVCLLLGGLGLDAQVRRQLQRRYRTPVAKHSRNFSKSLGTLRFTTHLDIPRNGSRPMKTLPTALLASRSAAASPLIPLILPGSTFL